MTAVELRIRTFGGLRTYLGQTQVTGFGARSSEALLAYLVRSGQPVAREVLAELLWPEHDPERAQTNLRTALHRLRRLLGPYVVADRWNVGLVEDTWSDASEFETDLKQGHLTEALDLYAGDFLAGFHLVGSTDFEEWLTGERERLRQRALVACQEVLDQAVSVDDLDGVLAWSTRLVGIDPLHEAGHRGLITAKARLGRRGAALDHYRSFRDRFYEEVGLEPDPATIRLGESLREEPVESAAGDSPLRARARHLPGYATPLTGREAALQRLAAMLADPACRLLTLTGPGGVGKTRLAVETARAFGGLGGAGSEVCFVPLSGVKSADLIFPALARELDPEWPPADLDEHLFAYLSRRRMLIVLDNFEHLLDGAELIATLLREAPAVKIMVTSRERLHLLAEWLVPVDGLEPAGAARQLFTELARRIDPAFEPDSHTVAIATICETVEGLPLALELAAAWLSTLSCEQIAARLPDRALMLGGITVAAPERHLSLRRAFGYSWDLLPSDLADAYKRLSVFSGGWLPEEAMEVAGASLEQLRALVEKSLVRKATGDRFDLHELLRQYAVERLDDSGLGRETSLKHFDVYAGLAATGAAQILGSGAAMALDRLMPEQDNFGAALSWALTVKLSPDSIAKLVCDLAWFWRIRGPFEVARSWLERVVRLDGLSELARAQVNVKLMNVAWMVGDLEALDRLAPETLAACEALGHKGSGGLGSAHLSLAMARLSQGRATEARELVLRGREHLQEPHDEDRWNLALSYGLLGRAEFAEGRLEEAQEAFAECVARFGYLGNQWGLGIWIGVSSALSLELGNLELAKRQAEEGIRLLQAIGSRHPMSDAYQRLALITRRLGDEQMAAVHAKRGQDYAKEFGW